MHKLTHREKPYECDVCQKRFRLSGHLLQHTRTHIGEELHECDFCQKMFSDISNLRKHKKMHLLCSSCGKEIIQPRLLISTRQVLPLNEVIC